MYDVQIGLSGPYIAPSFTFTCLFWSLKPHNDQNHLSLAEVLSNL